MNIIHTPAGDMDILNDQPSFAQQFGRELLERELDFSGLQKKPEKQPAEQLIAEGVRRRIALLENAKDPDAVLILEAIAFMNDHHSSEFTTRDIAPKRLASHSDIRSIVRIPGDAVGQRTKQIIDVSRELISMTVTIPFMQTDMRFSPQDLVHLYEEAYRMNAGKRRNRELSDLAENYVTDTILQLLEDEQTDITA